MARLIGDRTPPLLTVPSTTPGRADPRGHPQPQEPAHGQRFPAQPLFAGNGQGHDEAVSRFLPVQLTPLGGQPTRTPSNGHWPAPVVQAARPEPAPAPTAPSDAPPPSAPAVAPEQVLAPAAGADLPVQLDADGDTPMVSRAEAPAAGAPAPGAPAAGSAAGGTSPEELVKKLFDPLLRRLKTELRLDRERRGMLTDLRH